MRGLLSVVAVQFGPFLVASATSVVAQTNSAPAVFPATNSAAVVATNAPAHVASSTNAPPVPAAATAPTDPFSDPLIQQVQARHEKAVKGDAKETKALTSDLEMWTRQQPTNYLLMAYLGSTYTLDSRDAWPGPGKLTFLRDGGRLLDAAVGAAPDNPAVRFVRAIDYYELPAIFGKRQTARDDFQILLHQIDGEMKTPYALNIETQQAIYYYAGRSFYQVSQYAQAKATWQRGVQLDPVSELGMKTQLELERLK